MAEPKKDDDIDIEKQKEEDSEDSSAEEESSDDEEEDPEDDSDKIETVPDDDSTALPGSASNRSHPASALSHRLSPPGTSAGLRPLSAHSQLSINAWEEEGDRPVSGVSTKDVHVDTLAVPYGFGDASIWNIDGQPLQEPNEDAIEYMEYTDEEALMVKEFNDYYEDRVHKTAGPVIFVNKTLGMLPVIWTEEEAVNSCKSYFNVYTFVVFLAWFALAVATGYSIHTVEVWPADEFRMGENETDPIRYVSKPALDVYATVTWSAALITLVFGAFKCRTFAEILFGVAMIDAQVELREYQYEKIKRKTIYWTVLMVILLAAHTVALVYMFDEAGVFNLMVVVADFMAQLTNYSLDLQYVFLCLFVCKRYRKINKVLSKVVAPWTTFRDHTPSNAVVQNVLKKQFDEIFGSEDVPLEKKIYNSLKMSKEMYTTVPDEKPKVTREEENAFVLQLDILRTLHADLKDLVNDVNHLLGFQLFVQVITSTVRLVEFSYFFTGTMLDSEFYWPYLILMLLPMIRIYILGYWAERLDRESKEPFQTTCRISSVDGSARLERQVTKILLQMQHTCPAINASRFFDMGKGMVFKAFGVAMALTFILVKFERAGWQ